MLTAFFSFFKRDDTEPILQEDNKKEMIEMKDKEGGKLQYTVPLNELEIMQIKMILLEEDGEEALSFLKETIYNKIKDSIRSKEIHQKMVDTQTPWAPGKFKEDPYT